MTLPLIPVSFSCSLEKPHRPIWASSQVFMCQNSHKRINRVCYTSFSAAIAFFTTKEWYKHFQKVRFYSFHNHRGSTDPNFNFQTHICLTSVLWLCIAET